LSGAAGPHPGRLVLLRDTFGILSVMCCLDDGLVFDPAFQQDYREESAALEGVSESRVAVPLSYIVDATGRIVAVVRRHVEGVLLSDVLERMARGLDVQTAATVVKDVLTALVALHRRGVAHRSVDPLHVIVEPRGGSVLIDAGLQPRPGDQRPGAEFVADLAAVPQLFASCVTTGRLLPNPDSQRYFAAGELEGVSRDLCLVLDEAWRAGPERWSDGSAVGAMLTALNAAASDWFDAGWDDRGRERLASAAAQTPYPVRGRFFDFVPFADRRGRGRLGRGKRADVPSAAAKVLGPGLTELDPAGNPATPEREAPDFIGANPAVPGPATSGTGGASTVTVWSTLPDSGPQNPGAGEAHTARRSLSTVNRDRGISQAWQAVLANSSRRASEWLGDNWRTGADTVRASVSSGGLRGPQRRTARRRLRVLISRIAVPLIAFLVALALSRVFLGGPVASRTTHHGSPAPSRSPITSSIPVAAQPSLPPASPSPSATTTSAPPPPAVQPATVTQSPVPTVVTSVSITALAYSATASGEANVTVEVRTSGTAPINVAIKFSTIYGAFLGSSPQTDQFSETGKRDYTITDTFPVATVCSRNGSVPIATVDVSATVPGTTDAPLTASGQLQSQPGHC
jgi:hypothetical protein